MGEYLGGAQFLAGRLPYRDYFSTAMPLNILKSAGELWLFGNLPIVSRWCGVAERVLIAWGAYPVAPNEGEVLVFVRIK